MSLRASLTTKGIKIIEIVPPRVESELELHNVENIATISKLWMPLKDFTDAVMQGLVWVRGKTLS